MLNKSHFDSDIQWFKFIEDLGLNSETAAHGTVG